MNADSHVKLRENIKLLGSLLGKAIREQENSEVYEMVENVRGLSKQARNGDEESFQKLRSLFQNMKVGDAIPIARAFSHFLNLANIAEQHHRIRRGQEYKLSGEKAQRGSCAETFDYLINSKNISKDDLYNTICKQKVELVLTAHPTEVVRRTLLQKHQNIETVLNELDKSCPEDEKKRLEDDLYREIVCCWETDEIRRYKPTPANEAKWGFAVLEKTLWDSIPKFLRTLDQNLRRFTGKSLPIDVVPISFASWMGGDRDGNPNVTHTVTREVCWMARWVAANLYAKEIEALYSELSMTKCSQEMRKLVGSSYEPYRTLLRPIRNRLEETQRHFASLLASNESSYQDYYIDIEEIETALNICYRSLYETKLGMVADGRLLDVLRRLKCFGLSLVKLDIRQESTMHTEVINAITESLEIGSYKEWGEDLRQNFLLQEINSKRPLIPHDFKASDEIMEVLATFRTIAEIPADSLSAYVISMASTPSDILAVELLQKEMGVKKKMRVVPLFEKIADLKTAVDTLQSLFQNEWYRNRIEGHQEIMIGYSDSAKDGGRFAASWFLYKAQENLVAVCEKYNIKPTLFHGRGGTVGRGGGPTYLAILSQPPGSINGSLRVTEQGEMINAKFGLPGIAHRTLEIYVTATLRSTLDPPAKPKEEWRKIMDELAAISSQHYEGIVKEHPNFVKYFRTATPEVELGNLNIGSRPKKRKKDGGVESLRAIPWIFAWTQTRLILPSWLGIGDALSAFSEKHGAATIQEVYREWPFFQSLIDLIEMVMAKADIKIAGAYDDSLVEDELKDLGKELREKFTITQNMLLTITKNERLLDNNSVLRRSIDVRNPYVDPINLLQIEILKRLRLAEDDVHLQDALLITFNGIAAGMRNTG